MPWLWLVSAAVGLTSWWWLPPLTAVLNSYWSLSWEERDQRASVFGMVIGAASLATGAVSVAQNRRRADTAGIVAGVSGVVRTPRPDVENLPWMRELSAARARVHEASPLPARHVRPGRRRWTWGKVTGPALDRELPLFVERELSEDVTEWMRRARREGGFLLLVGTSSVGKTRLLFDTARRELGDFRVLAPDLGDGGAVNALVDAALPGPVVVWLDELQRFLAGPYFVADQAAGHVPVTVSAVRRLLDGDTPAIVLGTLWPEHLDQLCATDADPTGVTRPRHPGAADMVSLRSLQLRLGTFTEAEKQRAHELGARDPRLAVAAAHNAEFNVTETLAGVPRIMRRYREAPETRQAVVHAAVDARRLGIQGPLTQELLREAARGYLTGIHPDDTWFDSALVELTRTDRREDAATAPLLTLPTADHRDVLGYTVADYLLQELLHRRRSELLTDTTWNALIRHAHVPEDRLRLAEQAESRRQYRHAHRLYRALADAGDDHAADRLAKLLFERGKTEEAVTLLRGRAASGNVKAAIQLPRTLVLHGKVDELRALAGTGDIYAADRIAWMLIKRREESEAVAALRPRADAGDALAACRLALLEAEPDRFEELRARVEAGDPDVTRSFAVLLAEDGNLKALRILTENGDTTAAAWLAVMEAEWRMAAHALAVMRPLASSDSEITAARLLPLLTCQDSLQELHALLAAGDAEVDARLLHLLAEPDRLDELRVLADAGHIAAVTWLAQVLATTGRLEELRTRADADDNYAAARLARLLAKTNRLDELRARAAADDTYACEELVRLLVKNGEEQSLWNEVHAGNTIAENGLVELLRDEGREDEAHRLRRWGVTSDGLPSHPW